MVDGIYQNLRLADDAEKLLIQIIQAAMKTGVNADDVAAELRVSKDDARTLMAGNSMLRRRLLDSQTDRLADG